jgi:hypothetical protein
MRFLGRKQQKIISEGFFANESGMDEIAF